MTDETALVALDWGTSALRAWRLAPDGHVLERRRRPWGIVHLPQGGFAAAFADVTAGWEGSPALACGMVGSRQGWRETPYLPVPASLERLADGLVAVPVGDGRVLHLVPGLLDETDPDLPDVMRGEETQALGVALDEPAGRRRLVMPGTHSKWVDVEGRVLRSFRTFMTGELHAVLLGHSILGRDVPAGGTSDASEAFRRGVLTGAARGALPALFSSRALTLVGRLGAGERPDYLSGLLIGGEIGVMLPAVEGEDLALVGDGALGARYADAFALLGRAVAEAAPESAVRGLFAVAEAAGLAGRRAC